MGSDVIELQRLADRYRSSFSGPWDPVTAIEELCRHHSVVVNEWTDSTGGGMWIGVAKFILPRAIGYGANAAAQNFTEIGVRAVRDVIKVTDALMQARVTNFEESIRLLEENIDILRSLKSGVI